VNLDLVLRDLAVPGGVTPEAITQTPEFLFLYGVDGSRAGIDPSLPLAELASQVHDWAVEDLWARRLPTNWPPCPLHPGTHPLTVAARGERVVWECLSGGGAIAEVGSLPIPS
jgi:hypothetical protein